MGIQGWGLEGQAQTWALEEEEEEEEEDSARERTRRWWWGVQVEGMEYAKAWGCMV